MGFIVGALVGLYIGFCIWFHEHSAVIVHNEKEDYLFTIYEKKPYRLTPMD